MPSSAVRIFSDPDTYFSGIRNLQIEGVITGRGEFRAEATRIDLHRLWMHRFDEALPGASRILLGLAAPLASQREKNAGKRHAYFP